MLKVIPIWIINICMYICTEQKNIDSCVTQNETTFLFQKSVLIPNLFKHSTYLKKREIITFRIFFCCTESVNTSI